MQHAVGSLRFGGSHKSQKLDDEVSSYDIEVSVIDVNGHRVCVIRWKAFDCLDNIPDVTRSLTIYQRAQDDTVERSLPAKSSWRSLL